MEIGQFIESVKLDAMEVKNESLSYDISASVRTKLFPVKNMAQDTHVKATTNVFNTKFKVVKNGEGLAKSESVQGYTALGVPKVFGTYQEYDYRVIQKARNVDFVSDTLKGFAAGMEAEKDQLCADVFNYGGFTTPTAASKVPFGIDGVTPDVKSHYPTDGLLPDGKPLFSLTGTAHPAINGTTYTNSIAQALSIANLKMAWTAFASTNAKDEQGNPVDIVRPGGKAFLVVPHALRFTAAELVNQTALAIAAAGTNDSREFANLVEVLPWTRLTSTSAWFLTVLSEFGAQFLEGRGFETHVVDDPINRIVKVAATFEAGVFIRNWRFFHGNNVATS